MNNKVDLTSNRRFSINREKRGLTVSELFKLKKRKPWEPSDLQRIKNLINDPLKQLVLIGNKEQRNKTRYYKNMEKSCDRCGALLRKPWYNNFGLCTKCSKSIDEEYNTKNKGLFIIRRNNNKLY